MITMLIGWLELELHTGNLIKAVLFVITCSLKKISHGMASIEMSFNYSLDLFFVTVPS